MVSFAAQFLSCEQGCQGTQKSTWKILEVPFLQQKQQTVKFWQCRTRARFFLSEMMFCPKSAPLLRNPIPLWDSSISPHQKEEAKKSKIPTVSNSMIYLPTSDSTSWVFVSLLPLAWRVPSLGMLCLLGWLSLSFFSSSSPSWSSWQLFKQLVCQAFLWQTADALLASADFETWQTLRRWHANSGYSGRIQPQVSCCSVDESQHVTSWQLYIVM